MNDTRGYYNIIVHSVAILVLMSFRVLGHIAETLFKVLQEVDHHMKTEFGRSNWAYRNVRIPCQDSARRNGMCPTLWTLISTKLIMMLLTKSYGIQNLSVTSLSLISLVCFAFINNIDLPVT